MRRENRILSAVLVGLVALAGLGALMKFAGRTRLPESPQYQVVGANSAHGKEVLQSYGCTACHTIKGISGTQGRVATSLDEHFAEQAFVSGQYANTPENLIRWIRFPQELHPGNGMPDMGVTQSDAADMAAYLYSLR